MRDVLEANIDSDITFNTPDGFEPKTFRKLIHEHVNRNSWGSLGIDLALGSIIDKQATPYEHMLLPKYIFGFFEKATKEDSEKLVKASHTLYQKKEMKRSASFWSSPLFVFGLLGLAMLWLTFTDYKNKTRNKLLDALLFGITGIIGVLILLLWFATDHTATAHNYNLLWAFPLNLLLLVQLFKKQAKTWFVRYLKFLVIMLCLLSFHWMVGIELFAIGLIPLLMAMGLRYLYLIHYFKRIQ
jgi:hypothetical protein